MSFGKYLKESKSFIIYGLLAAIVGMILTFFVGGCGKSEENPNVLASKRVKIEIKEDAAAPPPTEIPSDLTGEGTPVAAVPAPKRKTTPAASAAPPPEKRHKAVVAKKKTKREVKGKITPESRPWAINIASFVTRPEALKLMERLKSLGYNSYTTVFKKGSTTYYRVRVGFYSTRARAGETGNKIRGRFRDVGKPWVVKPERSEVAQYIK